MSKLGSTAQGAAGGAAIGTTIMPGYGTAAGAILGGLYGYFSDHSDDVNAAHQAKQAADQKAAADYLAWRDAQNQAHMQNAANQLAFYQPSAAMLNSMNGGQGAPVGNSTISSPLNGTSGANAPVNVANPLASAGAARPASANPAGNAPPQVSFVPGGGR